MNGENSTRCRAASVMQLTVPPGHIGPLVLPGSGRLVYWTGRVAIGLRHERQPRALDAAPPSAS